MKNKFLNIFSLTLLGAFMFLAYASAPDPSDFRPRRKKKVVTEQTILNDPNLSDEEKAKMIADRKVKMDLERETKTVLATDLAEEYDNNEVSADTKYKNKIFYVDGVISDISKDLLNNINFSLVGYDIFGSVTCYIDDEEAVSKLSKGMRIVIRGRCDGTLLGVNMEDCEIVEIIESEDTEEEEDEEEDEIDS